MKKEVRLLISLYYKIGFVILAKIGNGGLKNILFNSNFKVKKRYGNNGISSKVGGREEEIVYYSFAFIIPGSENIYIGNY